MNAIELTDLNNSINIAFTAWIGAGAIRLKNKKDKVLFKTMMDDIKTYSKNNKLTIPKVNTVYSIVAGILFILLALSPFFLR
jgi:hypothetical protein